MRFRFNEGRSRFRKCLYLKENRREGEGKTSAVAPVPQILEAQPGDEGRENVKEDIGKPNIHR